MSGATREYETVIGLEVHVQLKTRTKAFCGCRADYGVDAPPNSAVCPVCLGMPGTLPVLNEKVLEFGIRTVLALGGSVASHTKFDRKNYFYPDLPKGYQISQYDLPLGTGGYVEIETEDGGRRKIRIKRVHMEEDAGKTLHVEGGAGALVDFNRCGVPLLEIVSEPDIRSPEEARAYLQKLKTILEYIEVSDCNMEEGSLRCDANISVRPAGGTGMGTKTEIKNMNSFRAVVRALECEYQRHVRLLGRGERIVQQTMAWDEGAGLTRPMRSKEEAHDYRYFPEPDLPPIHVDEAIVERIASRMPELPDEKRRRFVEELGIPEYDAGVLTSSRELALYFEGVLEGYGEAKKVSNWIMTEVMREVKESGVSPLRSRLSPAALAAIIAMVEEGRITGRVGKRLVRRIFHEGGDPRKMVEEEGLAQIGDAAAIERFVREAIEANPQSVADYVAGRTRAMKHLMGCVMKASRGKADPRKVSELLKLKLEEIARERSGDGR